jgi:hypothetical protein
MGRRTRVLPVRSGRGAWPNRTPARSMTRRIRAPLAGGCCGRVRAVAPEAGLPGERTAALRCRFPRPASGQSGRHAGCRSSWCSACGPRHSPEHSTLKLAADVVHRPGAMSLYPSIYHAPLSAPTGPVRRGASRYRPGSPRPARGNCRTAMIFPGHGLPGPGRHRPSAVRAASRPVARRVWTGSARRPGTRSRSVAGHHEPGGEAILPTGKVASELAWTDLARSSILPDQRHLACLNDQARAAGDQASCTWPPSFPFSIACK